jgi:hypothetical protein
MEGLGEETVWHPLTDLVDTSWDAVGCILPWMI